MICVGIDVAKDKHDCFIINTEGEVLADVFTVSNINAKLKMHKNANSKCTILVIVF